MSTIRERRAAVEVGLDLGDAAGVLVCDGFAQPPECQDEIVELTLVGEEQPEQRFVDEPLRRRRRANADRR